jgi:hypothetical protein
MPNETYTFTRDLPPNAIHEIGNPGMRSYGRGRIVSRQGNSLVKYSFEVNPSERVVRVSGGGSSWCFRLMGGRFVKDNGNNHAPEAVTATLEQIASILMIREDT